MKDDQAEGEASRSPEITSSASELDISFFFSPFFGLFAFLGPDPRTELNPKLSGLRIRTRITICVKETIVNSSFVGTWRTMGYMGYMVVCVEGPK